MAPHIKALLQRHRQELLLFLAATVLLIWTSLPNWLGYSLQDDQLSYVGSFMDPKDYAVHIAMLRAGMQGDWAYSFRFTAEPHQAHLIRIFYILLGQLNRGLKMDPSMLFESARWIFGYTALFSLFGLAKRVFRSERPAWLGFLLAATGSGLGVIQSILPARAVPVDFWLSDAYIWMSLALFPHFALTLTLMCSSLVCFLDYLERGGSWSIFLISLAALVVQLINPIAFILVDIVMMSILAIIWWQRRKIDVRQVYALAAIGAAQVPLLVYDLLVLTRDPVWSQFTLQNQTPSPEPVQYLWGFGLLWLLALAGSIRAMRHHEVVFLSMLVWITAAFVLAYLPFAIQRRFLIGITIPLGFLSAYGLERVLAWLGGRNGWTSRAATPLALLSVLMLSATMLFFIPAVMASIQSRSDLAFYPHELDPAFVWISANTGPDDFFLSTERTGALVAQKTGRQVFLGHPMETLQYSSKLAQVETFYQDPGARREPALFGVQWVIYGPEEREAAPHFIPGDALELIYDRDGVRIYRVK